MDTVDWTLIATVAAAIGSGLIGGLFLAFSAAVMPALRRLPVPDGIAAMQGINVAIVNPLFLAVFVGTALVDVALLATAPFSDQPGTGWRVAGALLYLAGSFVLTMAYNVPLNNALAAADAQSVDGAAVWTRYLSRWTTANHLRAVASVGSALALVLAARV